MAELTNMETEPDASFEHPATAAAAGEVPAGSSGGDTSTRTDRDAHPATPLADPPGLIKERRIKEDGRYIIFYWEEGARPHV